jgi:hypothetical protein
MNRIPSPKLSLLEPTVDISRISMSIGIVSLFLASLSFFLFSSYTTLSVTYLSSFSTTSFPIVVVANFSFAAFCSTYF